MSLSGPLSSSVHSSSGRARKPLPFPLPDPYATEFELFDPRGLNLKRRPSTTASASVASASTSVARLDDPPVANQQGQDGTAGLRVNTAQLERPNLVGTGSGTEQQLLFNMDMERVNSAASSQGTVTDYNRIPVNAARGSVNPASSMNVSMIDSPFSMDALSPVPPATAAATANPSPPPAPVRAASLLMNLRIGSAAAPVQTPLTPPDSSTNNFIMSPTYFTAPPSSSSVHAHARTPTNDSTSTSYSPARMSALSDSWLTDGSGLVDGGRHSRASSTSTSQSIASAAAAAAGVSPAQSFLSSFSAPSREGSLASSINGRLASAFIDGDEEGFQVAGYVLGRELGKGGFGVVREATRLGHGPGSGDKVAIKIVRHKQSHQIGANGGHHAGAGVGAGGGAFGALPGMSAGEVLLRRSASGYRVPRDRRMSLVQDRHRSASTPVPPHLKEQVLGSQSFVRAPPSLLGSRQNANNDPQTAVDDRSLDQQFEREPPTLVQALLEREIHLWRQLAPHPHIVQLIGTHTTEDFTYILMPLCEGGNLLDFLNEGGHDPSRRRRSRNSSIGGIFGGTSMTRIEEPATTQRGGLPLDVVKLVFAQIVEGLNYLHNEAGVTHKDIKLDNILCDERGGTWKIADFGLAESAQTTSTLSTATRAIKFRSKSPGARKPRASVGSAMTQSVIPPLASLSRANSLSRPDSCTSQNPLPAMDSIDEHLHPAGSLPYSPPEQMRSPVPILDPSVDVWALGCVLYALVQGVLPFQDEFEPRLRSKIMKGVWEAPSALLASGGTVSDEKSKLQEEAVGNATAPTPPSTMVFAGEEERRCFEVLKGCLEPDPSRRWTVQQIRESTWLTKKRDQSRGRAHSRAPASGGNITSSATSQSQTRARTRSRLRKDRSSSRSSSAVKHLGVDDQTRSREVKEQDRDERKMRWDFDRGRTRERRAQKQSGLEAGPGSGSGPYAGLGSMTSSNRHGRGGGGSSSSASRSVSGSRGRSVDSRRAGVGGEGTAVVVVGSGHDEDDGDSSASASASVFDLREVSRETERLGRVFEPY